MVATRLDSSVLLNERVQQWRPFSTYEGEMGKSRTLIESSTFIMDYGRMIRGILGHLKIGRDCS